MKRLCASTSINGCILSSPAGVLYVRLQQELPLHNLRDINIVVGRLECAGLLVIYFYILLGAIAFEWFFFLLLSTFVTSELRNTLL